MKPIMKSLLLTALVATLVSSAPVSSDARRNQTAGLTTVRSSDAGTVAPEGAWGRAAAVGCAFGVPNGALSNPALAIYTFGPCVMLLIDIIL